MARSIQPASLPKEVPELEGWQIYPYYRSAREVGDGYEFHFLSYGRLGLVVGDATGKAAIPSVRRAGSRHFLSSTSASGSLWRSRTSSCVSSPMAKYASCSRAHAPQNATPRISTSALRGQGFSA